MNNSAERPSRAALTIELMKLYDKGDLLAVLTISGREGTVTRVWRKGASLGPVTAPTAEDIRGWVSQAVWDWLVTVPGVQPQLPGMEEPPVQGKTVRSDG